MAGEPTVTVIGNLAADPELRFTASGHAVANLTIAQTPRNFDRQSNQWVDDEVLWVRGTVWREYAENVSESLIKGMHVIAIGQLKAKSFEDKNGNQRTNWELQIDDIGPSLRWTTAQVQRAQRNGNASQWGAQPAGQPQNQSPWGQQPQGGDGWSSQQPQQQQPAANQPGNQFGQPADYAQPQGQPQQGSAFESMTQGGDVWQGQPQQGQGEPPPF